MAHDHTHTVADDSMGFSQAEFLGWLGIGLIGLMALFVLVVLGSAGAGGFH